MNRIKVITLSLFCIAIVVLFVKAISSAGYTEEIEDNTVKFEKVEIKKLEKAEIKKLEDNTFKFEKTDTKKLGDNTVKVEDNTVKVEDTTVKSKERKSTFGAQKINIIHTNTKDETTPENSVTSSNEVTSENEASSNETSENEASSKEVASSNETSENEASSKEVTCVTGTIFIGDSRFVGMNNVCDMGSTENTYVIAKIGEGYNYLLKTVIPKIESIMASNKDVEQWNIISGFGINDLGNLNNYVKAYESMEYDNANLILVSVNPVEYHKSITNDKVKKFNSVIKEIDGTQYIDTYSIVIKETGYSTDGVHYKNGIYKKIYECIMDSI